MKTNIFKIRSKFLHLEISSFLQKKTLLKIIKYSNKLQKYTDITLEDYEIYSIIHQKSNKNPSLPIKIFLKVMKMMMRILKKKVKIVQKKMKKNKKVIKV